MLEPTISRSDAAGVTMTLEDSLRLPSSDTPHPRPAPTARGGSQARGPIGAASATYATATATPIPDPVSEARS